MGKRRVISFGADPKMKAKMVKIGKPKPLA